MAKVLIYKANVRIQPAKPLRKRFGYQKDSELFSSTKKFTAQNVPCATMIVKKSIIWDCISLAANQQAK